MVGKSEELQGDFFDRKCPCRSDIRKEPVATQEDPMNTDVLTTTVADGIAVIKLGSAGRIYFDAEMGDALTEALDGFAGNANVRVVVITGGAPGYFNRHFDIPSLIKIAESLRESGREWPENATYNGDSSTRRWRCVRACRSR